MLIVGGADTNQIIPHDERAQWPSKRWGYISPLAAAVGLDHEEAVKLLLGHGADPNLTCGNYATALMLAVDNGNEAIIDMLFHYGADVNVIITPSDAEDDDGIITTLQEASVFGSEETIRRMVAEGGANFIDHPQARFKTALHSAARSGRDFAVKVLLEFGSDVNARGNGVYATALQAAAFGGHTDVISTLLDAGADINEGDAGKYGSALMTALLCHQTDAVNILLERGADPSFKCVTSPYQYPIQAAAYMDYVDTVQLLCNYGANVNASGGIYHTALQAAAADGSPEILEILIAHGAVVNLVGGKYGTALAAAYKDGWYVCIGLLMSMVRSTIFKVAIGQLLWALP